MFCPHCGKSIRLQDQKFCDNCGFDLSKLAKGETSELKKLIDVALKEQPKSPAIEKPQPAPALMSQDLPPPIKKSWWRNLTKAQITILIIGGSFSLLMLVVLAASPSQIGLTGTLIGVSTLILFTLFLAYKAPVWGWGWYILFGLTFKGVEKAYDKYGLYQGVLQLFAVALALFVYFLFRKKYFKRVKVLWRRSLYSGAIAFLLAVFITPIVAYFIPTQDQRIAGVIQTEAGALQSHLKDFTDQNEKLWAQFISEPSTVQDYRTNLKVVEGAIPLYRHKDSVLVGVMRRIHTGMREIYDETTPERWSLSFTPSDFQRIADRTEGIATFDQLMLTNLLSYYRSLIARDGMDDHYWERYEEAQESLNNAVQEYASLYKKFFGYDLSKQIENQQSIR
ncbi:MAG: zinc-ribbon domain-containing protein [Ignavibacteriae bacterium]|nr:zinc-ribbon domain-containing protein [Ignavibacteriota bacterium]